MKFKEGLKKVGKVVGLWLLGKLKDLWEVKLREFLKEQLHELVQQAIEEVSKLRDSVEYELKREEIYNTLFDKLNLPWILKPFKWIIKKMLKDEIEKRISDTLEKLRQAI